MLGAGVLGATAGAGLALLVAMTIVLYRYYSHLRKAKQWGDLERLNNGKQRSYTTTLRFQEKKDPAQQQTISTHPLLADLHQARSYPVGNPRLIRTPSISSQGSLDSSLSKQSSDHRGSSPQIRTFSPDGRSSLGDAHSHRSPSPLRAASFDIRNMGAHSSSQSSLISVGSSIVPSSPRATTGGRCLSPLLIPNTVRSLSEMPVPPASPLGALQPDLYTRKEEPVIISAPSSGSLGKVHLSLMYDFNRSDLHIYLIEACDIVAKENGVFNDPYIRFLLSPAVDNRTRQVRLQPEENQSYEQVFKFPVSHQDLQDKTLIVQVFDYDRFSRNDIVGDLRLPLGDIEIATGQEVWGDIVKSKRPREEFQELLVTLSYLPSAERLTVTIVKARNLFLPEGKDSIDPYVKVYLLAEGKRSKKKKSSCIKSNTNPYWNEALIFSISPANLSRSVLEISVMDQQAKPADNPLLGCCLIGPCEDGERSHWDDLLNSPRKALTKWYTLR